VNASKNGMIMKEHKITTTNNNVIFGITDISPLEKDNTQEEENLDSE
jgi:hypothetical protein